MRAEPVFRFSPTLHLKNVTSEGPSHSDTRDVRRRLIAFCGGSDRPPANRQMSRQGGSVPAILSTDTYTESARRNRTFVLACLGRLFWLTARTCITAGRGAVIWPLAGLSAVPVWPIGWSLVLYIYTSPSLGRMSASAADRGEGSRTRARYLDYARD